MSQAESAHHSHTKEYLLIFVLLAVLTAVEVAVAYTSLAKSMIATILIVLAVAKAGAVAAFYMHLKNEKSPLIFIAVLPFIMAPGFTIVLIALFKR